MLKSIVATALAVGLLSASASQATTMNYFLNQSNKLADGINYLQVTISDEGEAGVIDFSVQALQPLLDIAGDNFGIQKFAFNVLGGIGAEAEDVSGLPDGWRARNGGRMDGFGLFDIKLKGRGKNRQDPLTFSVSGVDLDSILSYVDLSHGRAPEGFSLFAAQVSGINFDSCVKGGGDGEDNGIKVPAGFSGGSSGKSGSDGKGGDSGNGGHDGGKCLTSAYFGGNGNAVPAPPALWLLGTAVGGLVVRRFRSARTAASATA